MKNIVPNESSKLSKMWRKIKNIENSLFPELRDQLGVLSSKEEKLIKILDFAQIEDNITTVKITNPPKDREEIANPELDYKKLGSVQNGGDAMDTFANLHLLKDKSKRDEIRNDLLAYCRLDTLAMVKIWEKLKVLADDLVNR